MDSPLAGPGPRSSRSRVLWMLSLATLVALLGCNPVKKDRMATSLQNATNGYQSALRWGYYENAFGYVDPEKGKREELPTDLEDIRLTGYDVVQAPVMQPSSDTAVQIVKVEYLRTDRQVV